MLTDLPKQHGKKVSNVGHPKGKKWAGLTLLTGKTMGRVDQLQGKN